MTFGEKLRKYRTEKRLSQAELAKLAGLGVNTISNYESGHIRRIEKYIRRLRRYSVLTPTIYITRTMILLR